MSLSRNFIVKSVFLFYCFDQSEHLTIALFGSDRKVSAGFTNTFFTLNFNVPLTFLAAKDLAFIHTLASG